MSDTQGVSAGGSRRQWLLLGIVFTAVVTLLAIGYFLFLRPAYVVLAQGLRGADASAVVAELDKRGASYRLADGGATILVPEGEADATRVALAGTDLAARGEIGFELFNKSDMGLTNFAQKINYQRALQGELVRTIMAMDGVETARVHLALPERTLFRGDRAEPKAAVTVAMKPGQPADPLRVAGIQRLVAAAVPELPEGKVVVLDSGGRVISPAASEVAEGERPADLEERIAVENYYRARARGAVERQMPGMKFALRVLALPAASEPQGAAPQQAGPAAWTPSGEGAARNFRLRYVFVTETALAAEDQAIARTAILQATAFDERIGDSLSFETGPVNPPVSEIAAPAPIRSTGGQAAMASPAPPPVQLEWPGFWTWLGLALLAAAGIAWFRFGRARRHLAREDHDAFAAKLRRQLNLSGDDADAVA